MSKPLSEYDGKRILDYWLRKTCDNSLISEIIRDSSHLKSRAKFPDHLLFNLGKVKNEAIIIDASIAEKASSSHDLSESGLSAHLESLFSEAESRSPWIKSEPLVCKVDQGIKARGKQGLIYLNRTWPEVKAWITDLSSKKIKVGKVEGTVTSFIIEPVLPHKDADEYYISICEGRDRDRILFNTHGGVDVGDTDKNSLWYDVPIDSNFKMNDVSLKSSIFKELASPRVVDALTDFVKRLHFLFEFLSFSMLEINPLIVVEREIYGGGVHVDIHVMDLAAKMDSAAFFERSIYWAAALSNTWRGPLPEVPSSIPNLTPNAFGKAHFEEESYVHELDSKTGASLKLVILNPNGRIWTLVAGGGASVAYTDAVASMGFIKDLANYGEYSGAPTETQTYEYSKTIFELITLTPDHPDGKILLIGGGIANFTNVATTFKGICNAITDYHRMLKSHNVRIYVRRAGPNYQEGLRLMRKLGETLALDISVFGPETPMTAIVTMALSSPQVGSSADNPPSPRISPSLNTAIKASVDKKPDGAAPVGNDKLDYIAPQIFSANTRAIIYGMQPRAVQGMLDFDYMCKREAPSVACIVYPFGSHYFQKFYWGTKETLLPVFTKIEDACKRFTEVDVIINFSSFRSVYSSTMQMLSMPQIKVVCIIAEGVPDKHSRWIISEAAKKNVLIIGPATVGGIRPGCFKVGNTGGMMDNIIASKLYRPGSVSYVSKSGGMSNELNNMICINADGVREGIAIGGDRYPGSTFVDHIMRYESDPGCKMIVILGEVGGIDEYDIVKAIKNHTITKPVIAWCVGTCASFFDTSIQFGHAGSFANTEMESSKAKNAALKEAGAIVPASFEDLPAVIKEVYQSLLESNIISKFEEPEVPKIPIDYAWAQELGLIRKPASFISTICDDRGEELMYAGVTITEVLKNNIGLGGVLSLLWFKRDLPKYARDFIEMILVITADHGPAVSGAHNTIVTARAGKDLISSLVSGLLTIGERFGGALDGAARDFSAAYDQGLSPADFVSKMRKEGRLILGVGHKVKSLNNPDHRVRLIKEYVNKYFPLHNIFNYALEVEKITTSKKDNLILNVDGAIGAAFVDVLRSCGAFSIEEADEYMNMGTLNGLFVLGRSVGFIGHYLDQKRLGQGLYRHPWDDISYINPENTSGPNQSRRTLAESSVVMARGTGTS